MAPRPRNTAQRQAIAKRLSELDGFVSAQQLHESLAAVGEKIGLATVYRTLQVLADDHSVDVLRADSELLYRACASDEHHHHLVCRSCGKTEEFSGSEIEAWVKKVANKAGFVEVDHTIEFMGTCLDCSTQSK